MHLDACLLRSPQGAMRKAVDAEGAAQFTVDAHEQIPVERGRDPGGIVVGEDQVAFGLFEIDAEQQGIAG